MKSKIKLKDLPVLIKSDRRFQIGLVVLIIVVFWPLLDPTKGREHTPPPRMFEQPEGTGKTPDAEVGQDLVTAFKQDLDSMNQRFGNLEKNVEDQGQNLRDFEGRTAEIFKKVLERVAESENGRIQGTSNISPQDLPGDGTVQPVSLDTDKLEPFGETEKAPAIPEPPPPSHDAFIGAGDSVRVELLGGVNAFTDGTPYPALLKLSGDVLGPDHSALPLGEARLIAASQGSLTDSRALFRLTSLNIRLPNGRRKVIPVDGWIVGEDGIRGMAGVLYDPIGKAIAGAGFTGALAGLGEGIKSANSTTYSGYGGTQSFISGSTGQYAAGAGLSGMADTWSDIIKDRLELLVPVVQVLSGRQATAVFAKSVVIPDLYEALEEQDTSSAALD